MIYCHVWRLHAVAHQSKRQLRELEVVLRMLWENLTQETDGRRVL